LKQNTWTFSTSASTEAELAAVPVGSSASGRHSNTYANKTKQNKKVEFQSSRVRFSRVPEFVSRVPEFQSSFSIVPEFVSRVPEFVFFFQGFRVCFPSFMRLVSRVHVPYQLHSVALCDSSPLPDSNYNVGAKPHT
jgi:hypothetical protein